MKPTSLVVMTQLSSFTSWMARCFILALVFFCVSRAEAKTVTIGTGSGTLSVTSMGSLSLVAGDTIAINTGTYSGATFTHLNNVTIVPGTGGVNFTAPVGISDDSAVTWDGTVLPGVTYGFTFANFPVGNSCFASIGANNLNCTIKGVRAIDTGGSVLNGAGGNLVYNGTTASCVFYNMTVDTIKTSGSSSVYQGTFANNTTYYNVCIGLTIRNVICLHDGAEGTNECSANNTFNMVADNWVIVGPTIGNTGDQGIFNISGNCTLSNIYRSGGWGWLMRIFNSSLVTPSTSYIYNCIDLNNDAYGTVDTRIDIASIAATTGSAYPLAGNGIKFLNDTAGNHLDLTGYRSNLVLNYGSTDGLGSPTVYEVDVINCFAFNNPAGGVNPWISGSLYCKGGPDATNLVMNNNVDLSSTLPSGYITTVYACYPVPGGPLVGTGATVATTADDIYGYPRTGTYDIGAVQHDTENPVIDITSPTTSGTYATTAATVDLSGTASDNDYVFSTTWSNSLGGSGSASTSTTWASTGFPVASTTWSITALSLAAGHNVITVTAHDASGLTGAASLDVVRSVATAITSGPIPGSATIGSNYNYSFTTTGYPAPTFTVTSGALPPGMSISSSTGQLTGTPTAAGTYNGIITVTNGQGSPVTKSFSIVVRLPDAMFNFQTGGVAPGGNWNTVTTLNGSVANAKNFGTGASTGITLSISPAFTSGSTYGVVSTALYPSPVQSQAFAVIGSTASVVTLGNLTPSFTYDVTLFGSNATNPSGAANFTIPASLQPAIAYLQGNNTNKTITFFNVTPDASGHIALNVVPAAGVNYATLSVLSITSNGTANNAAPGISNSPTTTALAGSAYSFTYTATGVPLPTFSITSGALPGGLTISPAGTISGTASSSDAGPYSAVASATNGVGSAATSSFTITVSQAAAITSTATSTATVGKAYSFTYAKLGYPSPTFTVTSGSLPAGLTLSAFGTISGTPTTAGTSTGVITAANGVSSAATTNFTIVTTYTSLASVYFNFEPANTPTAPGGNWSTLFAASGNTSGSMANSKDFNTGASTGIGVSATGFTFCSGYGVISSALYPSPVQTYAFATTGTATVTVTGLSTSATYDLTIFGSATGLTGTGNFTIGTSTLGLAVGGNTSTTTTFHNIAPNGSGNIVLSVSKGTMSNFNDIGVLIVTADSSAPTIIGTPPAGSINAAYSFLYGSTGYPAPTFSVTSGALPGGLSLSAGGLISGVPSAVGTYTGTVTATNGVVPAATSNFSIAITGEISSPTITGVPTSSATAGSAYSFTFGATGNPAPTFSITSGSLPTGLTLGASSGAIGSTVSSTASGPYTAVATAGNLESSASTPPFTIYVNHSPAITNTAVSPITVTIGYTFTYSTTGYPAPTFSLLSGTLPTGLSLTPAGTITGTPTATGTYTGTVSATNGIGSAATSNFTIASFSSPTLSGTAPGGTTGTAYSYAYTMTGVPTPTCTIKAGGLPPGLTLSGSGVVSGTPTTVGTFTGALSASNGAGTAPPVNFSIAIAAGTSAPTISGTPLTGTNGMLYSFSYTVTGSPSPTCTVTSGSLPAGLSLTTSGAITGTPTATGTSNGVITAANGIGSPATQSFSIVILAAGAGGPQANFNFEPSGTPASPGGNWNTVFGGSGNTAGTSLTSKDYNTGASTGFGVTLTTWTFATNYGVDSSAIYPSPIQKWGFAIQSGAFTGTTTITGLSPSAVYRITVFGSGGSFGGLANYTIGTTTLGYAITNNTTSIIAFNNVMSDGSGNVVMKVTSGTNNIGELGALIVQTMSTSSSTPPSISGTAPGGVVGTAYSYSYTVGGSPAPTCTVTSGSLPAGLTLAGNGTISGVPTTAGTSTGTITAANGIGSPATKSFSIVITQAPSISGTAPGGSVGSAYSYSYTVTGSPTPTCTVTSGSLPSGLSLAANGTISGTPAATGTSTGVITAANGVGSPATTSFSIVITSPLNVYFNFEPNGTSTAPGGNWNTVYGSSGTNTSGTSTTSKDFNTGASTGVTVGLSGFTFASWYGKVSTALYTSPVQTYSFATGSGVTGTVLISGLNSAKTYSVTVFGSDTGGNGPTFHSTYTIGTTALNYVNTNNTTATAVFSSVTPNGSGQITMTVNRGTDHIGSLGALIVHQN